MVKTFLIALTAYVVWCLLVALTGNQPGFRVFYTMLIFLEFIMYELDLSKIRRYCGSDSFNYQKILMVDRMISTIVMTNLLLIAAALLYPGGEISYLALLFLNIYAFLIVPSGISPRVRTLFTSMGNEPAGYTSYVLPPWRKLSRVFQEKILHGAYRHAPVYGRPQLHILKKWNKTVLTIITAGKPCESWCPVNTGLQELMPYLENFPSKSGESKDFSDLKILQRGD